MEQKKTILTYAGLKKLEDELHDLKVNKLEGKISNESPVGKALIGAHKDDIVDVETPAGIMQYKVLSIQRNI